MTKRAKSFKARHAKNIKKGKMSAAYWANRVNGKMPQIGSDDKHNAVLLRRSMYRNAAGKGAKPRPRAVSKQAYEDKLDRIFGKKKNQTKEQS